jgi:DNA-binding transcriptional ArsR family regulator
MAKQIDGILEALADPTRRAIVELLRDSPQRAGAVAAAFPVAAPTISRHLRVLRVNGLIEEVRDAGDARVKVYRLNQIPFTALSAWVDQMQAFWRDQLGAFAEYVVEQEHVEKEQK